MFVDEITIYAEAGDGGNGVERWRHDKFRPMAGPAGGDGGVGGDVIFEAVADMAILAKYTGNLEFKAAPGEAGQGSSKDGHRGEDCLIKVPVGARIIDTEREREYELTAVGQQIVVFKGGRGGRGNEHFKSSTNRSPKEVTAGRKGESGTLLISISLTADVGFIGLPNAGKSTLLNLLTNARSQIGAYPFTTTEPHLGEMYGLILADIPGLIEGASNGKGLGHKFLRHITKTKMLCHLVSLDSEHPIQDYYTIRHELSSYDEVLAHKEEWVIFTKKDLVNNEFLTALQPDIDKLEKRVFFIDHNDETSIKHFRDALVEHVNNA